MATAAASQAALDDDLIRRTTDSLLAKELRKQQNKEAIAEKTIEILAHHRDSNHSESRTPDDDWLNVFERYAENASSEKLRDLWARILAGEIRKPQSFSLKTMRFVSELDQKTASIFEGLADKILNGSTIPKRKGQRGEPFHNLLRLEEFGLLSGVQSDISNYIEMESGEGVSFSYRENSIGIKADTKCSINFPVIALTLVGQEIASILAIKDSMDSAREFVELLPKEGLLKISYGKMENGNFVDEPLVLWEKPHE